MKKIIIGLLTLFLFVCISCSDNSETPDLILGIWNISTIEFYECENSSDNELKNFGIDGCYDDDGVEVCCTTTFEFISPDTLISISNISEDGVLIDLDVDTLSYSFSENLEDEITLCYDGSDCDIFTILISEDTMTLDGMEYDGNCKVKVVANQ